MRGDSPYGCSSALNRLLAARAQNMKIMKRLFSAALFGALSACGGGGSPGAGELLPASSPGTSAWGAQGLWRGGAGDGRSVMGWSLPDGTYWWLYSKPGVPAVLGGVFQGSFVAMNGNFSSPAGHDFNLELLGVRPLLVAGSYAEKASFGGTGTIPAATVDGVATSFPITLGYDVRYESQPLNGGVPEGDFKGAVASPLRSTVAAVLKSKESEKSKSASVTLDVSTASEECRLEGSLTASNASLLIYTVVLAPVSGVCPFPMLRPGSAYFDRDTRKLHVVVPGFANTDALVFVGSL